MPASRRILALPSRSRYFTRQFLRDVSDVAIQSTHEHGLICNLFWSDDLAEARTYAERGIDVILTNCADQLTANNEKL